MDWMVGELDTLSRGYCFEKWSVKQIAEKLDRTEGSVLAKIRQLKLRKGKEETYKWFPEKNARKLAKEEDKDEILY